jgi:two-component system heavy metal sensor histidine kinase CusS
VLRQSITWRITFLFAALSSAVLITMGTIAVLSVERHFAEEDLVEIHGKLELIRHAFQKIESISELKPVPSQLNDALVGHHALSVAVYTVTGEKLYGRGEANFPKTLVDQRSLYDDHEKSKLYKWQDGSQTYRGLAVAMSSHDKQSPTLIVAIALDIAHHQKFITRFHQTLWLSLILGTLLMSLLGWLAVRRGLSPIRDFDHLTQLITANRLYERLKVESVPKELRHMAESFNKMLSRLEKSFQRLSDFSSNLAHELRTPVSNLMMQTQVMLAKQRSLEDYQEILISNLEEYDRLARMVSDMLFLAKAENDLIIPQREPIDLAKEVAQLIEFYEPLTEEKRIHIVSQGAGIISGDKLMIRRAINNLISNAIQHTPIDQLITVDIRLTHAKKICLIIENPCADIDKEHLDRLFDRFYHVDPSRQRNSEGAGLGLAITKSIIEAHGGGISVSTKSGRIRFEFWMMQA